MLRLVYKPLFVLAVVAMLLTASFGGAHVGMDPDMQGQMSGCPFMGMSAICNMTPLEHITAWQNMFTTLPQQKDLFALFFALFGAVVAFLWMKYRFDPPIGAVEPIQKISYQAYIPLATALQELFARGILNPKPF